MVLVCHSSGSGRRFAMTPVKIFIFVSLLALANAEVRRFPDNLQFGVATASYQIEGGWDAADKGENIWDRLTHTTDLVIDRSSGDVACDSYNKNKRDVEMLVELGVQFYRFSLSWSRLLPDGFANKVSEDGLRYYNELINDLLAANITPSITLYHWDLPQPLQELGGWANPMMVEYFADYADIAFEAFGDRVKTWLTFNEPWVVCVEGYGTKGKAPALDMSGIADYICAHNLLKAHAEVYHLYDDIYRPTQKGRIGLTLNAGWVEPASDSSADKEAANIDLQFNLGWYAHPIFSRDGDYPALMKERIAQKSSDQGYPRSRLPEFTDSEIEYIQGTSDFFGLNHYTTSIAKMPTTEEETKAPNFWDDINIISYQDPSWPSSASSWLKVVPWGFAKLLTWIKNEYNGPEIIVFENGFSDRDNINDDDRVSYYNQYLNSMLDAIEDGANVTAYTAWSLMDNFEWVQGYTERFGLYYVNFNDPNRPRTAKKSALFYKQVIASRTIEREDILDKVIPA